MGTHVVKQGECFASIASAYGVPSKVLYDHPDNAELKKARPNPNILHPGDRVVIPEKRTKEESVPTGQMHRFRVKLPKRELRVVLLDHEGKPIAGEAYVLDTEGKRTEGQTTAGGEVIEAIDIEARTATLTIQGRVLTLACSHLNPLTDTPDEGATGARERLRNLGYAIGGDVKPTDPCMRTALALFQHDHGLDVTGKLDDATRAKLAEAHRC